MTSRTGRLRATLLVGIAVLATAACAPALDWREVRPEASDVQALMPCRPQHAERRVPLAGQAVKMHLESCSAGGLTWGLAYADLGDPARVGNGLAALQASAAGNIGAPPVEPERQAVPGSTPQPRSGRSVLQGRSPEGKPVQMHVLVFARGTTVFQASAVGEAVSAEAAQTFFSSVRFPS